MLTVGCVIITYNQVEQLPHIVRRLTGFDEVVIINNASTDDYTSAFAECKSIREVICGELENNERLDARALARNYGVENLTTDIVLVLDGDIIPTDMHFADTLRSIYSTPAITNKDIIMGDRRDVTLGDLPEPYTTGANITVDPLPWGDVMSYAMAFTREHWNNLGGMDTQFRGWGFEDTEFAYRTHLSGGKTYQTKDLSCHHIEHEQTFLANEMHIPVNNCLYFMTKHRHAVELIKHLKDNVTFFDECAPYITHVVRRDTDETIRVSYPKKQRMITLLTLYDKLADGTQMERFIVVDLINALSTKGEEPKAVTLLGYAYIVKHKLI